MKTLKLRLGWAARGESSQSRARISRCRKQLGEHVAIKRSREACVRSSGDGVSTGN